MGVFSKNKFVDYFIWCLLRVMLYQFLLIFAYYNYNDLPKYTLEFQEKTQEFARISNITYPSFLPDDLEELLPIFRNCLLIIMTIGLLATLGSKLFQFISGVLVIGLSIIYFHPLKPSAIKEGEQWDTLNQKYPWIDTLLISFYGIGMIIHSLYNVLGCNCEKWLIENKDTEVMLEEDAEELKKKEKKNK